MYNCCDHSVCGRLDAGRVQLGPAPAAIGLVALAQSGLELGEADAFVHELRRRAEVGRRERLDAASALATMKYAARWLALGQARAMRKERTS